MNTTLDIKPLLKERYAGANKKSSKPRFRKLKDYIRPKSEKHRKTPGGY